ncbi:PREDICTED: DEAD-box ATP-dependent RNA helicase 50-like isoform X2 [Populus euphratica]|uniref:DEAD-box ATP-dependent RNA helicase 50-like isoform X2 n=1 Tax=Populus euphratica TaxID=75702 RepID=A0AAJ6TL14_POPEU|nr:PREDICTED: DEAD-box ATP-dependent RNA helicase 50-like isoform X2 [Populus euphratica]
MAHPLLVSLRPQSIIIAYHSHSHSHSELKLNSSIPRVLSLVRAVSHLQASASHSHLVDDLHHTPSPPSNKDDSGIETKGVAANFGKLKAHKLKFIARKAKQQFNKHQHFREEEEADKEPISRNSDERGVNRTSRHDIKPRKSDSKVAGTHISSSHSRGWGKGVDSRSMQVSMQRGHENDFFSRKSFRDLGCTDFMIESLKGQVFVRPSHIQAMAFAPVIDGKSCVIADQSGSGKTMAYLIPLIQRLRQEELQGLGQSSSQSPRVLILVPTAELASQVLNNCRSMSKHGVPFRSMVVTGGFRQRTQLENLEQGVDVLIATPGRFMFLIKEGFLKLQNLKCAVLDEIDILFNDESFEASLQGLINSSPVTTQYLFVTATLPVDVCNKLIEVFPDCEVIMGPGVHRTSARLEEILVDCSGEIEAEKTPETAFLNKKSALLQLVEQSPVSKTIIFCNKIETCRKVENALKRTDRKGTLVRVLPFHAALAQESRLANMKEFMNPSRPKEESLFLVCTDRASRGIDFSGVDHVVLFDFPRDPSEYVRRVGRTARGARGNGKAFIFAVGKQVFLARRIIQRNEKGHPLHDVPFAYEQVG